ncbi:MAG: hypothetical protein Hyperionvirus4_2 [Hyperionvirus sp.]|uniref:Uncharacterized protein n=1 Tax=Hyperionvirus sp. TaxID=2487770 RepID=A0A3G5A720_9VIRU|nr:MAG: hypothetical protein Hyperionvirus4_2 [Hyperionvirus sp.]
MTYGTVALKVLIHTLLSKIDRPSNSLLSSILDADDIATAIWAASPIKDIDTPTAIVVSPDETKGRAEEMVKSLEIKFFTKLEQFDKILSPIIKSNIRFHEIWAQTPLWSVPSLDPIKLVYEYVTLIIDIPAFLSAPDEKKSKYLESLHLQGVNIVFITSGNVSSSQSVCDELRKAVYAKPTIWYCDETAKGVYVKSRLRSHSRCHRFYVLAEQATLKTFVGENSFLKEEIVLMSFMPTPSLCTRCTISADADDYFVKSKKK